MTHLKPGRGLSLLARERAGRPEEAEHFVHHVGVVYRLHTSFFHLLHHLLLPSGLLFLPLLPLSVLFGQLSQTLLKQYRKNNVQLSDAGTFLSANNPTMQYGAFCR